MYRQDTLWPYNYNTAQQSLAFPGLKDFSCTTAMAATSSKRPGVFVYLFGRIEMQHSGS